MINKKRKEFRDSQTKENLEKLKEELLDVSKIMTESFEMILNRDKNLNKIGKLSSDLKDNSKKVRNMNIIFVVQEGCKEVEVDVLVETVCHLDRYWIHACLLHLLEVLCVLSKEPN